MNMKKIRLGDVATYVNGYAFKPSDRGEKGLPIIRIQDLTGNSYQANKPLKIQVFCSMFQFLTWLNPPKN